MQRYYLDEKWTPTKLDARVPVPDTLNLEHLRGKGVQPGESELPEDAADAAGAAAAGGAPAAAAPEVDELILSQLLSMGLTENAAKRACVKTGNSSADAAAMWYFEHTEDPDINDPLPAAGGAPTGGGGGGFVADPEAVGMLTSMGFSEAHVTAALKSCSGNAERAADWLFSHADDLDAAVAAGDDDLEVSAQRGMHHLPTWTLLVASPLGQRDEYDCHCLRRTNSRLLYPRQVTLDT